MAYKEQNAVMYDWSKIVSSFPKLCLIRSSVGEKHRAKQQRAKLDLLTAAQPSSTAP